MMFLNYIGGKLVAKNGVIRVNEDVKKNAEMVLAELGLSAATAVEIFFRQISRDRKFPFSIGSVDIPNETTIRAMCDADNNVDLQGPFSKVKDLMGHLNA